MSIPYVGFSNSTLRDLPKVKSGDEVHCPHCNGRHILEGCKDEKGNPSEMILSYKCGGELYMGAIDGRLVAHVRAGVSGSL